MVSDSRRSHCRNFAATAAFLLATGLTAIFVVWMASPIERETLLATAILGFCAAIGAAVLGLFMAAAVLGGGSSGRFFFVATAVAAMLPIIWHLAAWDAAFGRLGWFGGTNRTLEALVSGWTAAVWVHVVAAAPLFALLVVFFRLDAGRIQEEQALVEADPWTVWFSITLPRMIPVIGVAGLWVVITASREIAVTDIYQIGTVAEQVYLGFALGQLDQMLAIWPDGPEIISMRLYVLTVGWLVVGAAVVLSHFNDLIGLEFFSASRIELVGLGRIARWLGSAALFLSLAVPLANLVARAGMRIESGMEGPKAVWSIVGLIESLSRAIRECQIEFYWSSIIAVCSASLILAVALFWSGWAWRSRVGRILLFGSIAIMAGMPGPMCGALLWWGWGFVQQDWAYWLADRTIYLQVLANCTYCWPLAGACVWIASSNSSKDLDESARLQGMASWGRFWSINVLSKTRLWIGLWLIFWVLSFGELSAQQMVAAPGIDTIPRQLLGWLHAGVDELAAAASLLIGALFAVVGGIGAVILFPRGRRGSR